MSATIHILKEGLTLCGFNPLQTAFLGKLVPFYDKEIAKATCWRCICIAVGREGPKEPATPEHDKLHASNGLPQKLCEFVLEFLPQAGIQTATMHHHTDAACRDEDAELTCGAREGELFPTVGNSRIVALAAEFIGVDQKAFDKEKDDLLKYVREMNALEEWAKTEGRKMLKPPEMGTPIRCDKSVRAQNREQTGFFLCDEEPGHGGKCHTRLYRRR